MFLTLHPYIEGKLAEAMKETADKTIKGADFKSSNLAADKAEEDAKRAAARADKAEKELVASRAEVQRAREREALWGEERQR